MAVFEWAHRNGFIKTYLDSDKQPHTVIRLTSGSLLTDEFQDEIRRAKGLLNFLAMEKVPFPILYETMTRWSREEGAPKFFLSHPAVLRHEVLKVLNRQKLVKRIKDKNGKRHSIVILDKAFQKIPGGKRFVDVMKNYHGGELELPRVLGIPLLYKNGSQGNDNHYLSNDVVFRNEFLKFARKYKLFKRFVDAKGVAWRVIVLPGKLRDTPSGRSFENALQRRVKKTKKSMGEHLTSLVEVPIVANYRGNSEDNSSIPMYLSHPAVFNHEFRKLASSKGLIKRADGGLVLQIPHSNLHQFLRAHFEPFVHVMNRYYNGSNKKNLEELTDLKVKLTQLV